MNIDYHIKNFKVFDKEGSYVDIRPITILTGCNNSGKSSIVKSLCLLNDFCRQADACLSKSGLADLTKIKLDFHKSPNNIMGSFTKVVHQSDSSDSEENSADTNGCKSFSLKTRAYSNYFLQYMNVELTFVNREGDHLDNGYLKKIEISTMDDEVVYSSEIGGDKMYKFESLKSDLLNALLVSRFVAEFQKQYANRNNPEENYDINEYNFKLSIKSFNESLNVIINNYTNDIFCKLFRWCTTEPKDEDNKNFIKRFNPTLKSRLISADFFNASKLNVFSYFPFMGEYKDTSIQELKDLFHKGLAKAKCEPYEIDLVDKLFENVENSENKDLLEYVSQAENILFNRSLPSFICGKSFIIPPNVLINDDVCDGIEFPDKLRYGQIIYALNKINQVLTGNNNSYISGDTSHFQYFIDITNIFTIAIIDLLQNTLPGDLLYSRTEGVSVKRLYSLENGTDFAELLKDYFEKSWRISKFQIDFHGELPSRKYKPGTFLNKWVNELGLAHHVDVSSVADGLGASIRMYSSENDKEGMLLADMGYGSTQLFMIILKIENAILDSVRMHNLNQFTTEGFNEELIDYIESDTYLYNHPITVALEEPENHLHPSLQSKLADMLVDAYKNHEVQFLVETHSEYLIRKLQLLIAQEHICNESVSILYVNSKNRPSYMPLVRRIGVDEGGNLEDVFGPGFFDESFKLSKELIKANIKDDEGQN